MKASDDIHERRNHPRVYMDLPLEYRVSDAPHLHGALVVNVSESGLQIQSVKNIPVGSKLKIAVLFPKGFELANFEVFAEIVWKDTYWQENREDYQFGLKFINIPEEDYRKLKQLLDNGHEL